LPADPTTGTEDSAMPDEPSRRSGRRRATGRAARLALLCLLLPTWNAALAAAPLPAVVVTQPLIKPVIEEVAVTGTVRAPRIARLSPEVPGLVDSIGVDAGDRVTRGDVLLTLDAALAQLDVDAAEATVEIAREELADARRRLADAERLRESRGIPETEVEARRSEVRADAATLKLRRAEAGRERERLRRFTLAAPFDGIISAKLTERGEWVTPGDQVLELVADEGLRVDFRVPQRFFPRLDTGTPLTLRIASLPDREVTARIGTVVPVSDDTARTFEIRTHPDTADLPLTHGMSASGTLALATGEERLVVPRDALLRHPDGRITAWVIDTDGDTASVSERQLRTGLAFDGFVVVLEGLEPGQRVVVEGNETLRQGQGVRVSGER
jgi:RND family efflux transporter MFP subunit